jgi:hypothetical protein
MVKFTCSGMHTLLSVQAATLHVKLMMSLRFPSPPWPNMGASPAVAKVSGLKPTALTTTLKYH